MSTHAFKIQLAYLVDIFSHLNDLNIGLQGSNVTVVSAKEKMQAFDDKLMLWKDLLDKPDYSAFPNLKEIDHSFSIKCIVEQHLKLLRTKLRFYFPRLDNTFTDWVQNPFVMNVPNHYSIVIRNEQISLKNSSVLKAKFDSTSLVDFWCTLLKTELQTIAEAAIKVLIQFATTYRCEQGFSVLTSIKSKSK